MIYNHLVDMMMLFGKGGGVGDEEENGVACEEKGDCGGMQTSVDCN